MKSLIQILIVMSMVMLSGCVNDLACPRNCYYSHSTPATYRTNVSGGRTPEYYSRGHQTNSGHYAVVNDEPENDYYGTSMLHHSHRTQTVTVNSGVSAG